MIPRYEVLRQRLQAEQKHIRLAAHKAQMAYQMDVENTINVDAASLNLHSFYSGVERLLEWVARQIDGTLPQGSAWHRELLTQMTLSLPGIRPAVLQADTAQNLGEYLGFRHIVRNLYSWDLEDKKVGDLVAKLPTMLELLERDLTAFDQFLDAVGHADEI